MNTLKTLISVSGLIVALGGWSAANAATYKFDFTVNKGPDTSLRFDGKRIDVNDGGTLGVTVSGGPSQSGKTAIVQSWSGGLGVMNDALLLNNDQWIYNDAHYVDNNGSTDFALFKFDEKVKVEKITISIWGKDGDITLTRGDSVNIVGHYYTDKAYANNLAPLESFDITSSLADDTWRIFASLANNKDACIYSKNNNCSKIDGFKIKSMTVSSTVVPLPAAVWLFGSALLGMVGIGYRRQNQNKPI